MQEEMKSAEVLELEQKVFLLEKSLSLKLKDLEKLLGLEDVKLKIKRY